MTKKLLSIVLALVFCITVVAVPMTVTASATNELVSEGSSNNFETEFSAEDSLPLSNDVLTDQDGKEFYNVRYCQSTSANDGYVSGDLVTLEDGDGVEHTLMDVKFVKVTSGPKAVVIVPVDENGKPFKMEDNTTYQISYGFYVKKAYTWKRLEFGRGAFRGHYSKAVDLKTEAKNYAVVDFTDSFVTSTCYPVDAVTGATPTLNQHQAFWPIENAFPITVSYGAEYNKQNWYDNKFEGVTTFTTGELKHTEDGYITMPDTKYDGWGYYYDDYFTISTTMAYDTMEDVPPEILFDYITVKKALKITLDAGDGLVNGKSTDVIQGFAGNALPAATIDGDSVFEGWCLEGSSEIITEVTDDLDGKTLYAHYKGGVAPKVYDFEGKEVLYTAQDVATITGSDGAEYKISAWCFQTGRAASKGLGRDGSVGLRCGAGTQTHGVNGLYPLNDGVSFYYLQPNTCYTVTMDIKASINVEKTPSADLVYGPFYDGGFSTDGTKCKGTLAEALRVTIDGAEYPGASNVVNNEDGWDTVTYKFKTPEKFPDPEPTFPLPDILAIRGTWTYGAEIVFDNIVVEKAPAVEFVLENGKTERQNYYIGDTINFPTLEGTQDIIYEDGTGFTSSGISWFKDSARTEPVGTEVVGTLPLKFYEKNSTLIPYNTNQASYFGYETDETNEAIELVSGGYESATAAKIKKFDTSVPVGSGKLIKGVTYKATFFYKADSAATVKMNGVTAEIPAAGEWTRASVTFTAKGEDMNFRLMTGTNVIIDTFMVSKAVMASGAAILTDEAEEQAGGQALRVFFDYVADEDGKTQINGEKFDVTSRGVVLIAKSAFDGTLTKDTKGAVVKEISTGLDNVWAKGDEKLTYSTYISGLSSNDKREIVSVGFVTLSDGNTYYSDIQSNNVENAKKAVFYKKNTNTYSLANEEVRNNVVINTRYDVLDDGITFDYTCATLRFKALCQGEGSALFTVYGVPKADGKVNNSVVFDVFVDGKAVTWRANVTAKNDGDTCALKFNVGDEFKEHTIEIVRSTERNNGTLNLNSFTIHGELGKEEQRAKMIEFIGDSVTCGGCNYETWSAEGTYTYAYRTAQALGVDYRMVSHSGSGLMYNAGGEEAIGNTWIRNYDYENYVRSTETKYTCERQADIVCVFLGTNDAGARSSGYCSWDKDDFKDAAEILIGKIRAAQPGVKVAWVINGMDPGYNTSAQYAIEELGGEAEGLYIFDFGKTYHNGGNWHPSGDDHAEMAETMIKWFNDTDILNK